MSQNFELTAQMRSNNGTAFSRRLRREQNRVPAIVYGGDQEPRQVSLLHNKVTKALESEAFFSSILKLDVEGAREDVVLKAVQRHPSKPFILHMDFMRVKSDEPIIMNVPIHFIAEEDAPGVQAGGIVSRLVNELEVRCLPKNLPEFIEVNLSTLELNQSIHLSEITLPTDVTLLIDVSEHEHDQPVVSIHPPRAEEVEEVEEEPTAEEEAAAGEEGEQASEGESAAKPEEGESKE